MDNKKLFIGSLPWSVTSESLKEMFSSYGEITDAVVISDRATGRSRGFGFVTFAKEEDAEKAKTEMNGKDIEGRAIVVNTARQREERTGFRRNNDFRNRGNR